MEPHEVGDDSGSRPGSEPGGAPGEPFTNRTGLSVWNILFKKVGFVPEVGLFCPRHTSWLIIYWISEDSSSQWSSCLMTQIQAVFLVSLYIQKTLLPCLYKALWICLQWIVVIRIEFRQNLGKNLKHIYHSHALIWNNGSEIMLICLGGRGIFNTSQ